MRRGGLNDKLYILEWWIKVISDGWHPRMKTMKRLFGRSRRSSTEDAEPGSGSSSPRPEMEISLPLDFKR
jgi:hypothetical protein